MILLYNFFFSSLLLIPLSSHLPQTPFNPIFLIQWSLTSSLFFPTYYRRCDSSIAKLSADVSFREQQVIRLQREVRELSEAVNGQLKELEDKVGKKRMHADKGLAEKELREQVSKTLHCVQISYYTSAPMRVFTSHKLIL